MPPRLTFAVSDLQYVVTFAVMLVVALVIANLVASVRAQTRVAGARERRTTLLYAMSRELAATRQRENIARVAVKHVAETFSGHAAVLVPDAAGRLLHPRGAPLPESLRNADLSVAQWVFDHGRPAGLGTDTLPAAAAQYQPLRGGSRTLGVLAVRPTQRRRLLLPEQQHLLETFAGQIGLAFERASQAEEAEAALVAAETESLRNTLLASISHDLRTPLAAIAGAGSALADPALGIDSAARVRLATTIEAKAREMSKLISNVLDLMRFESGEVRLRMDWQTLDDLVGTALGQLHDRLIASRCRYRLARRPAGRPGRCPAHHAGLHQPARQQRATTRLPERASSFQPCAEEQAVRVVVEDNGPGLPPGDPERLFKKFQRGRDESSAGGAGLGLAICRAIIAAHGGTIAAAPRPEGGTRFAFTLPTADPVA